MNRFDIFIILIGRNSIFFHIASIGMAFGTGPGDILRIDRRSRSIGRLYIVNRMAGNAIGDFDVASFRYSLFP